MKRLLIFASLSVLACKTENKNVDIQDKQVVKESNKLSIKEQDSLLKNKLPTFDLRPSAFETSPWDPQNDTNKGQGGELEKYRIFLPLPPHPPHP